VIGTAGKGVVNIPYQVTDRALAAEEFGFSGTLERCIEECATTMRQEFQHNTGNFVSGTSNQRVPPGIWSWGEISRVNGRFIRTLFPSSPSDRRSQTFTRSILLISAPGKGLVNTAEHALVFPLTLTD
jgi:hypothetical protein